MLFEIYTAEIPMGIPFWTRLFCHLKSGTSRRVSGYSIKAPWDRDSVLFSSFILANAEPCLSHEALLRHYLGLSPGMDGTTCKKIEITPIT